MKKKFSQCRLCSSNDLEDFITLEGTSANISNCLKLENIGAVERINLTVKRCSQCDFVQLNETLDDSFYQDYIMSTSFSNQMKRYSDNQVKSFIDRYNLRNKKILDVGCGDGGYMHIMLNNGIDAFGVEPSLPFMQKGINEGLNIQNAMVGKSFVPFTDTKFDGFVSRQVLEHIDDIHDFLQGIKDLLKPDGVGLIEVPNLNKAIIDSRFYDFFPDHLNYFSKETLRLSIELNGFKVDLIEEGMFGEYLVAFFHKKQSTNSEGLQNSIKNLKSSLKEQLLNWERQNKINCFWGAGAKGISILSICNINSNEINFLVDSDINKIGKYTPVSHIKIQSPLDVNFSLVDNVIISALAYKNEIIHDLIEKYNFKGEIFTLNSNGLQKLKEK